MMDFNELPSYQPLRLHNPVPGEEKVQHDTRRSIPSIGGLLEPTKINVDGATSTTHPGGGRGGDDEEEEEDDDDDESKERRSDLLGESKDDRRRPTWRYSQDIDDDRYGIAEGTSSRLAAEGHNYAAIEEQQDEEMEQDDAAGEQQNNKNHRRDRAGRQDQQASTHAIYSMTPAERQLVLEEIHGVASSALPESPDFVAQKLQKLGDHLQRIRKKSAHDRAVFLCPKYVNSPNFQLMFLRAERFDPRRAAKRFVQFFEKKMELWGERMVARRITVSDLSEEDKDALTSGTFQIINSDQARRPIIFLSLQNHRPPHTPISRRHDDYCRTTMDDHELRAQWFQIMRSVEGSENAQKNGLVKVVWNLPPDVSSPANSPGSAVDDHDLPLSSAAVLPTRPLEQTAISSTEGGGEVPSLGLKRGRGGDTINAPEEEDAQPLVHHYQQEGQQEQSFLKKVSQLVDSMPARIVALHYCELAPDESSSTTTQLSSSSFLDPSFILGHDNSYRFRSHVGSALECQKQLDTFGIPRILLPIEPNSGRVITKGAGPPLLEGDARKAMRLDDADETYDNTADGKIWIPGPVDVLLGRGRPYQDYDGNKLMNQLIEDELNRCWEGKIQVESAATVDCVWNVLKEKRGVRFLKRSETDPEEWSEVEDSVARGKVYFAVRIQVRKRRILLQQEGQKEGDQEEQQESSSEQPKRRRVLDK